MVATKLAMSTSLQLLLLIASLAASIHGQEFIFYSSLKLDGATEIMPNGSAVPVNPTGLVKGQVFYAQPLQIKSAQTSNSIFSFSTSFVFSIKPENPLAESIQEGLSFIISSSKWLPLYSTVPKEGDGKLENSSSLIINFKASQDWIGIENNHLEITANGVRIVKYSPLGYYGQFSDDLMEVSITRGQLTQVWLDYDGKKREISITVAPVSSSDPGRHSFSYPLDVKGYISDDVFVGLSTSKLVKPSASKYYLVGWSMKVNGKAQNLDLDEIVKYSQEEIFGSQIAQGFEEVQKFPCLGCLKKYLLMMNCTAEQIEVLEGQCLADRVQLG